MRDGIWETLGDQFRKKDRQLLMDIFEHWVILSQSYLNSSDLLFFI